MSLTSPLLVYRRPDPTLPTLWPQPDTTNIEQQRRRDMEGPSCGYTNTSHSSSMPTSRSTSKRSKRLSSMPPRTYWCSSGPQFSIIPWSFGLAMHLTKDTTAKTKTNGGNSAMTSWTDLPPMTLSLDFWMRTPRWEAISPKPLVVLTQLMKITLERYFENSLNIMDFVYLQLSKVYTKDHHSHGSPVQLRPQKVWEMTTLLFRPAGSNTTWLPTFSQTLK